MPSRSTVTRGFISELDGLRGVAILLVMVHRFWPRTGVGVAADAAGAGWIGVDLFFVISGFLITGILLDTRGEPGFFRNFYARRVLRIFPLYYLFVGGVLLAFSGNPEFRQHAGSPLWYLAHLGNVPEGVLDHDVPYWLAPVWSLAIEEQFYLTFPLLVYFLDRRRLTIVLIAMLVAAPLIRLGTMLAVPEQERIQYLFTLCRIDTIAIGCLLAVAARTVDLERWRARAIHVALGAVVIATAIGVITGLDRTTAFGRVLGYSSVAFGCAGVISLVVLGRDARATSPLRWAPLMYLGKLCFGLYLLHRPADTLVSAVADRWGIDADLRIMPIKLALAIVLATISWKLIERPFLGLKAAFSSTNHPGVGIDAPLVARTPFVKRLLRLMGFLLVLVVSAGCRRAPTMDTTDAGETGADALTDDARADAPGEPDAGSAPGTVLYPEGQRHSPITPALVARLQSIAASSVHQNDVFAKVGDSITATSDFVVCFNGGAVDLGSHGQLSTTIAYYLGGNAAGGSPFERTSIAAVGGTMARDVLAGSPSALDRELAAVDPRLAIVLFGTNEVRYGRSVDDFGEHLWNVVDEALVKGVIPLMSTIPPMNNDLAADARIPTFNRVVRAIAQGRGVPFVDLHRELVPLPNRGLAADRLHPSTAPGGGCVLTDAGLQFGYNVRNLITLEALARVLGALGGGASDPSAMLRVGTGTAADPIVATLPLVDLGDTRTGDSTLVTYACGGPAQTGREVIYQLELQAATTIEASVVDRGLVDVDLQILDGSASAQSCVARGDKNVWATVGPGTVFIVVETPAAGAEGEYALVVSAR